MKKLYFIRHGQSQLGAKGLYAGRTETPLTEEGRAQARIVGKRVKGLGIDQIVVSPSGRTVETAQIIAEELGYYRDKILKSELLRERNLGALEAQPYTGPKDYAKVPGAETDAQLLGRAKHALQLLESLPAENILVVGHSGMGRALRGVAQGHYSFGNQSLANAEIYRLK